MNEIVTSSPLSQAEELKHVEQEKVLSAKEK